MRFQWIPVVAVATLAMFLGGLVLQSLTARGDTARPVPPTVAGLADVQVEALGLQMRAPTNWAAPAVAGPDRLVLSPDGATDTGPTAGPFLYVVADALEAFSSRLTLRTDLEDPQAQLNALLAAMNFNGPRFGEAQPYYGARYPGALVRGSDRGNEMTIVLLRGPDGRWLYVGAQAAEPDFRYYELTVFKPVTDSIAYTMAGH